MANTNGVNVAAIFGHIQAAIDACEKGKPTNAAYVLKLIMPDVARLAFLNAEPDTQYYAEIVKALYKYSHKETEED